MGSYHIKEEIARLDEPAPWMVFMKFAKKDWFNIMLNHLGNGNMSYINDTLVTNYSTKCNY